MKKKILIVCIIIIGALCNGFSQEIIIDHSCTDLSLVPQSYIDIAKSTLRVGYSHTSHGSQLVTGIAAFRGNPGDAYYYESTGWGLHAGIFLNDYWANAAGASDLGHNGDLAWRDATVTMLNNTGNDRNVVIWSWCGGVSDNTASGIDAYLNAMNELELQYPDVTFVYMTGHLDGSGLAGNLHLMNERIRDYCRNHDKILFDFADIESYNPDGTTNFNELYATDGCEYDTNGDHNPWGDGNWATEWITANPSSELAQIASNCDSCAHSQRLNCVMKGRAFWWMMARLAGWGTATEESMTIPLPSLIQMNQVMKDGPANIVTTAVNGFNEAVSLTLEAKDVNGGVLGTVTMIVPANGSAVLSVDSFSALSYDSIQATTDRHLLLFSRVTTDTANMTAELSTWFSSPLYVPHIADKVDYWDTYAFVSNSNPLNLDVTIAGQTASRTAVPTDLIDLEAMLPQDVTAADAWGKLVAYASNPFINLNSLSGFEMFVKTGSDGAATELVGRGSTMLYIPHVPENTDIFWTGFTLLNTGTSPATATATFYDDNGIIVGTETLTIPANSKIKGLMTELFPDQAGTACWGTISANQVINGIEIYGTYNAGICGMALPTAGNTSGILPDVLIGEGNWTGITITNVSATDSNVTIQLMAADGTLKAEKTESIAAMHRFKAVVADYFSEATLEAGDTVRYSATSPVVALETSGDLDRTFMSALTGSR